MESPYAAKGVDTFESPGRKLTCEHDEEGPEHSLPQPPVPMARMAIVVAVSVVLA